MSRDMTSTRKHQRERATHAVLCDVCRTSTRNITRLCPSDRDATRVPALSHAIMSAHEYGNMISATASDTCERTSTGICGRDATRCATRTSTAKHHAMCDALARVRGGCQSERNTRHMSVLLRPSSNPRAISSHSSQCCTQSRFNQIFQRFSSPHPRRRAKSRMDSRSTAIHLQQIDTQDARISRGFGTEHRLTQVARISRETGSGRTDAAPTDRVASTGCTESPRNAPYRSNCEAGSA